MKTKQLIEALQKMTGKKVVLKEFESPEDKLAFAVQNNIAFWPIATEIVNLAKKLYGENVTEEQIRTVANEAGDFLKDSVVDVYHGY